MKIIYLNCGGGVAGDMILAALFGAGLSPYLVEKEIKKSLPVAYRKWKLIVKDVEVDHLPVKKVQVAGKIRFKSPREMKNIISGGSFSGWVKKIGGKILQTLITAEARVHQIDKKDVHFHEINSIDTLVDILGSVYLLDKLSPDKIICSAVNLGRPAPATLEIAKMKGVPVFSNNFRYELATPTGIAIVSSISDDYGDMPKIRVLASGHGIGTRKIIPPPQPLIVINGEL